MTYLEISSNPTCPPPPVGVVWPPLIGRGVVVVEVVVVPVVVGLVVSVPVVDVVVPGSGEVAVVVVDVGGAVPVVVWPGVVVVVEVVLGGGRFGYTGLLQQALGSAWEPVWGASSKVIAISPPDLYAADCSILGITDCRKPSADLPAAF